MPRGDGTGPMGMGPMTGRGAGFCNGFSTPGYANQSGGGFFGRMFGRGFRRMFYATGVPGWARYGNYTYPTANPADEKAALKNQADFLENQLSEIKKRLSGLDKDGE